MNKNKTLLTARWIVLTLIMAYVTYKSYMHQALGGGVGGSPSVHALCPYGGLESLYSLVFSGTLLKKIFPGTMLLLFLTVLLALLFRRSFCGWICPFGAIQEFFGWIGRKLFGKKLEMVNKPTDKGLRLIKYGVLPLTAVAAWFTGELWMSPYDPWAAYAHIFEGLPSLLGEYPVGTFLLAVTIIGSLFYDRFFCKYLCPMGAFLAIISKASPHSIKRDNNVCIHCNACTRACPVNIDVAKLDEVKTAECISCQKCTLSCPKEGALEIRFAGKFVRPAVFAIVVLGIFFGGLGIGNITGMVEFKPAPLKQGETINVDDIKGSMTIQEVSDYTKIPLDELYEKLGIPKEAPPSTRMKDVSNFVPGFETETARELLRE